MRVITGSARGKKLEAPAGTGTRPTSDRAKEAVFSAVGDRVRGARVLDLYAGSGQLAVEALSRGAAYAAAVDISPECAAVIKKNAAGARVGERLDVIRADVIDWLSRRRGGNGAFGLVFIDPPYAAGLMRKTLLSAAAAGIAAPGALIVCEAGGRSDILGDGELLRLYDVVREAKYGKAYTVFLTPAVPAADRSTDADAGPAGRAHAEAEAKTEKVEEAE